MLIRELATKYKLKGYDIKPLQREKVIEFISQMGDLQKSYKSDYENLQVGQTEDSRHFSCLTFPL
jgi:DNA repair protein RAD50